MTTGPRHPSNRLDRRFWLYWLGLYAGAGGVAGLIDGVAGTIGAGRVAPL